MHSCLSCVRPRASTLPITSARPTNTDTTPTHNLRAKPPSQQKPASTYTMQRQTHKLPDKHNRRGGEHRGIGLQAAAATHPNGKHTTPRQGALNVHAGGGYQRQRASAEPAGTAPTQCSPPALHADVQYSHRLAGYPCTTYVCKDTLRRD
jgi:hypothetical protein